MTDLFKKEDVISLLQGKTLLILGGSIQRGIYKDIIWLMNSDTLINRGVSKNGALQQQLFGKQRSERIPAVQSCCCGTVLQQSRLEILYMRVHGMCMTVQLEEAKQHVQHDKG